jgi:hypothetical protein
LTFINQLLQLIQTGLAAIFRFIGSIWQWTIAQIGAVPWNTLGELSVFHTLVLIAAGAIVVYALYKAARELLEAGEKLLTAFASTLSVFVHTLPYILMAGVAAAGSAWIVTHVNL